MGISVEQYRSRIGSHDNFLKTNYALSRFKDRFWNILQRMFYMNVFYLPTLKQAVGQYNIWNEWSLVYPIYVLQCLHAIVDTMSIIRKPQRFWYLKSYNIIVNFPVHIELCCLWVYYSVFLFTIPEIYYGMTLWVHSFGVIWIMISDHSHGSSKEPMNLWPERIHQFHWCTVIDPDPVNPKEMHPLSLLNFLVKLLILLG